MQVAGKHTQIYEAYYRQIDPKGAGCIEAMTAAKFLKKSGLSDVVLSRVSNDQINNFAYQQFYRNARINRLRNSKAKYEQPIFFIYCENILNCKFSMVSVDMGSIRSKWTWHSGQGWFLCGIEDGGTGSSRTRYQHA